MSTSSKPVKKMNLGDTEKEIFIRILKETDNGKIYDKLVHGIGTIQQRSDLWKMVREMFNREIGRDATVEQLRKLFGRMKDKAASCVERVINSLLEIKVVCYDAKCRRNEQIVRKNV